MNHEKINKLLALAERGIDGEAVNAKAMLKKVLAKHGYTIEQYCQTLLPDERLSYHKFSWKTKHEKRLLISIIMLLELDDFNIRKYRSNYEFEITEAQAIELDYLYQIYRAELNKELDAFVLAFIFKNELHSKNIDASKPDKQTKADKDRQQRILNHHSNIKPLQVRKALE